MTLTRRILRYSFILAPALVLLAAATLADAALLPGIRADSNVALLKSSTACSDMSKSAYKSCKEEKQSDYWLAVGKCQNLSDPGEQQACLEDAAAELTDGREECKEQLDARLEVCEDIGEAAYQPAIDPANFVAVIDNPFLPFKPGSTWTYEGQTDEGTETDVVHVTGDTKVIMGVTCTVVHDSVYLDGDLTEDTLDYYAQDAQGNVWYFGELSYEVEDNVIVSLEGSWEAGVDGAVPGIVMFASPTVGDVYRQEFLLGEAEDMGEVLDLNASVSVAYGDFNGCVETADYTPLEPDVLEHKFYAPGVGMVLETDAGTQSELISYTP